LYNTFVNDACVAVGHKAPVTTLATIAVTTTTLTHRRNPNPRTRQRRAHGSGRIWRRHVATSCHMIFSSCFDGLLALLLPDGFAFSAVRFRLTSSILASHSLLRNTQSFHQSFPFAHYPKPQATTSRGRFSLCEIPEMV
jgi:hypothetical protein